MDICKVIEVFLDLTNLGMIIETFGIFLVAKYGVPRNDDLMPYDKVVFGKQGEELSLSQKRFKSFICKERVGFILMGLGVLLMLVDRNL